MLHFDIDFRQLTEAGQELNATPKQVQLALSRALSRTASALRTMSGQGLKSELDLRRLGALRKRLKSIKLRSAADGVQLWYGLNDMPVSWFKGTPKETADGATFRGQKFPGAFVAKSSYARTKTIMKRKGKARLHIEEQLLPVEDKAAVYIEDNIFDKLESIFWPIFMRDLQARVKYKIGAS
ncbi:hypothetical protein D3C87_475320 [compost metagenome]